MRSQPDKSPRLTDAERHKRFIEMAKEVGASESAIEFDRAFMKVTSFSLRERRSLAKKKV